MRFILDGSEQPAGQYSFDWIVKELNRPAPTPPAPSLADRVFEEARQACEAELVLVREKHAQARANRLSTKILARAKNIQERFLPLN